MQEKLIFENMLVTEPTKPLTEAEPSHGSNTHDTGHNIDGNTDGKKLGFARSVVSKTLPALISYIQPLDYPSGFIFGLRARGGIDTPIVMTPDNIEYQNTPAPYPPNAPQTTINVTEPYTGGATTNPYPNHGTGHNTQQEMTVARKSINTNLREVVINTTNEVEQDIKALFGNDYQEEMDIEQYGLGEKKSIAKFFNEFAFSEMVKKTNLEFTVWLEKFASPVGTITLTGGETDKLLAVLGELQGELMTKRGKMGGRMWVVVSPVIAGILSSVKGAYDNTVSDFTKVNRPNSYDNSYVTTLGNMDIYVSPYLTTANIIMGIVGGPNSSSVYYTPYKEYVVIGAGDVNTGHNNFFYRVRDDWETNPLDTFNGVEPSAGTEVTPVDNASDYLVSATITYTSVLT